MWVEGTALEAVGVARWSGRGNVIWAWSGLRGGAKSRHSDREFGGDCGSGRPRGVRCVWGALGVEEWRIESGRGQKYGDMAEQREVAEGEPSLTPVEVSWQQVAKILSVDLVRVKVEIYRF